MTETDNANTRELVKVTPLYVQVLAMMLVLLPCIAVSQFVAHWEVGILDDHLFAYGGWRILDGATLYRDIWDNKPPGVYWIDALGVAIGGGQYGGIILLCVLASVTTCVLFFVVAASTYRRGAAAIATMLAGFYLTHGLFFGGGNRSETFLVPCELAAIAVYLRGFMRPCGPEHHSEPGHRGRLERRRWWCWYGAGLCAGGALLFKQTGFAALGAIGLHVVLLAVLRELPWRTALQRAALLVGGLATVVGAAIVILAAQGTLGEACFAVFTFNRWYLAQQERHWLEWWWWAHRFEGDILSMLRLPIFIAVAACVHAFLRRAPLRVAAERPSPDRGTGVSPVCHHRLEARATEGLGRDSKQGAYKRRQQDIPPACPRYMALFGIWFVIAMAGAVASPLSMGHYLLPAMPPLLLMSGYLINVLKAEYSLFQRFTERAWVLVAFLAMGYFASDAIYLQIQKASTVYWDRNPRIENGKWTVDKTTWEEVGEAVARITEPDETIQCWEYLPAVYLQARRPNACRFITVGYSNMVGPNGAGMDREFLETVVANPPKIIVMSTGKYNGLCGSESTEQRESTDVGWWLGANYRRLEELTRGNLYVLMREDGAFSRLAE